MAEPDELDTMSELDLVAIVEAAAREDWRAATWLLARQYPDRWGRPAVRADQPPEAVADGLDDLAGRRDARRSAASS